MTDRQLMKAKKRYSKLKTINEEVRMLSDSIDKLEENVKLQ